MGSRPLHEASWILLGALLGSSLCFVVADSSTSLDTGGAVSFASLAVCTLLLTTLRDRAQPLPALRRC
jgi:hypothetical protein